MSLWSTCIVYKPALLEEVYAREELSMLIIKEGLLSANDMQSRAVFKDAVLSICSEVKDKKLS
jgi:hypothetical protein